MSNLKVQGNASGTGTHTLQSANTNSNITQTLPDVSGVTLGFLNVPQSGSDKTTSYTLALTDIGEFVGVGTSGSITIPDATFAAGDIVSVFNNTSGNITQSATFFCTQIINFRFLFSCKEHKNNELGV